MKEEIMSNQVAEQSSAAASAAVKDDDETAPPNVPSTSDSLEQQDEVDDSKDEFDDFSFLANSARRMARRPCTHFAVAFVVSLAVSVVGFLVGDFSVSADNTGWLSRGTTIADQTTQLLLLNRHDDNLNGNSGLWKELTTTVQAGFEDAAADEDDRRRQLQKTADIVNVPNTTQDSLGFLYCEATSYYLTTSGFLDYSSRAHLWPVWKARKSDVSLFDPQAIQEICEAEETTQQALRENNLCGGCGNECFPPVSIILAARYFLEDNKVQLSCAELAEGWKSIRSTVEAELVKSVQASRNGDTNVTVAPIALLAPFFVDDEFGVNGETFVKYSTSIFSTAWAGTIPYEPWTRDDVVDRLFDLRGSYDRLDNSNIVAGAYDTSDEDFLDIVVDEAVIRDMSLAVASAVVTAAAILIHTRSPWITLIGLAQIVISFPLAFFFYNIILRLSFFPFLNFIGVFVTFALGADDVFVACDKWKNARLDHPNASIEYIASKALPDAAKAMFLTTITTATAFFATAICPTTALKMFAIFLGLLIIFDYVLCVLLVFPALCLYDRWNHRGNCCCVSIGCGKRSGSEGGEKTESMIRRILSVYYGFIHRFRYVLVAVIVAATLVCVIVAARLELPTTSEVRLLNESNELEKVFLWKFNLFAATLDRREGSKVWAVWGLKPSDTGNHNDPTLSSAMVLDDSFDPAPEENQQHLLNFCIDFFEEEFSTPVLDDLCAMKQFDSWLAAESTSSFPSQGYDDNCGGSSSVPVAADDFHACMISFAQAQFPKGVYYLDGQVKIIRMQYRHVGVAFDSAYDILDSAWNKLSAFLQTQNSKAPAGVNKAFASSLDFWWFDTNGSILSTAYGAISIALAAAFIVVLLSSRSFEITLFAIFTIGFILASVTALLVATGWTLGFLESVCFAILVGMSCDFVLHFGHAYSHHPGHCSRHERTKDALIKMGPSILAAAITTIASAVVMMFTSIIFFQRFAVILFYSLVMGLFGSAFVFLVLTDTFGPAEPTVFVDSLLRCSKKKSENPKGKTEGAAIPSQMQSKDYSPEVYA